MTRGTKTEAAAELPRPRRPPSALPNTTRSRCAEARADMRPRCVGGCSLLCSGWAAAARAGMHMGRGQVRGVRTCRGEAVGAWLAPIHLTPSLSTDTTRTRTRNPVPVLQCSQRNRGKMQQCVGMRGQVAFRCALSIFGPAAPLVARLWSRRPTGGRSGPAAFGGRLLGPMLAAGPLKRPKPGCFLASWLCEGRKRSGDGAF